MVLTTHFLLHLQKKFLKHLLANCKAEGAAPGCIVASPSKENPDYFYHWFRDAALSIGSLLHVPTLDPSEKRHLVLDWLSFEAQAAEQLVQHRELEGAGEAKVYVDGRAFTKPWGRPQYDSSALRLFYGLQALELLVLQGLSQQAGQQFELVLARDIEFTCQRMAGSCFDLWEECHGLHFFTLASQCAAISEALASRWPSPELRARCSAALQKGESAMQEFLVVREEFPYFPSTLHPSNIEPLGRGWCDSSVLLAVSKFRRSLLLHPRTVRTLIHLANQFATLYPVNKKSAAMPLMGRYAEDVYFEGNPWVICTCFAIEWCYAAALFLEQHPVLSLDKPCEEALADLYQRFQLGPIDAPVQKQQHKERLLKLGDQWLTRLLQQISTNGKIHSLFKASLCSAEQLDKETGRWVSAEKLTWNSSALLDLIQLRLQLDE